MTDRRDQLKKLYDADPNDPFVTYGLAMEDVKAGDDVGALAWLDKTLDLDAGYCYAYYQKGLALGRQGKPDEAKAAVEQGIARAKAVGDAKATAELEELLTTL